MSAGVCAFSALATKSCVKELGELAAGVSDVAVAADVAVGSTRGVSSAISVPIWVIETATQ
jgi:hypothetical protein